MASLDSDWSSFYDAVRDRPPHDTLLLALDRFDAEGPRTRRFAVDLGCGDGRDTVELLRRGWRVLAIDGEGEAIERLRSRPEVRDGRARLETEVARFEDAHWPEADLVNAGFALPFCAPGSIAAVWGRIVHSLPPGGRFSGHLLGLRDGRAPNPERSFHSRDEVAAMLDGFDLERFDEVEEDGRTATGAPRRWHLFHIVARRL